VTFDLKVSSSGLPTHMELKATLNSEALALH
jgi:hypothetical protein